MRLPAPTTAYKKDLRRQHRRGKDLAKLTVAIEEILESGGLPRTYKPHKLSGDWNGVWECPIEPDWLLIYDVTEEEVPLIRTGSHADLFS